MVDREGRMNPLALSCRAPAAGRVSTWRTAVTEANTRFFVRLGAGRLPAATDFISSTNSLKVIMVGFIFANQRACRIRHACRPKTRRSRPSRQYREHDNEA